MGSWCLWQALWALGCVFVLQKSTRRDEAGLGFIQPQGMRAKVAVLLEEQQEEQHDATGVLLASANTGVVAAGRLGQQVL